MTGGSSYAVNSSNNMASAGSDGLAASPHHFVHSSNEPSSAFDYSSMAMQQQQSAPQQRLRAASAPSTMFGMTLMTSYGHQQQAPYSPHDAATVGYASPYASDTRNSFHSLSPQGSFASLV